MIPENELGVIILFAQRAKDVGCEILCIQSEFPDALVNYNGKEYRVEFEYNSSNFKAHGHDIRECDLIICWIHDFEGCILPVLELSNPDWTNTAIQPPTKIQREASYWKDRALSAERQLRDAEMRIYQISTQGELMPIAVRHERLKIILTENGREWTQQELADELGVSRTTIKRDLKAIGEEAKA